MHFRITAATGQVLDEGECRVELAGGAISVSPQLGQPLRITGRDVAEVSEPAPYTVRLRLSDGASVDLSQLGVMRTQLLAEFRDVHAADTVQALLLYGVGRPEIFPGACDGIEAEIRLYDDALVCVPVQGTPVQLRYSFIDDVSPDASGYRITVRAGDEHADLQRMARRTTEFVDLLRERVTAARGRTSAFLGALLPGLSPLQLRSVAALLRDSVAAPRSSLDALDASIWPALLAQCCLPERRACVEALGGIGEVWIGFHQRESVEVAGSGGQAWQPAQPMFNARPDHGGDPGGAGAMLGAAMMQSLGGGATTVPGLGGGFGADFGGGFGPMLAMGMMGFPGGMALPGHGGDGAPPAPRGQAVDVERGTSTAAHADLGALSASPDAAITVVAFTYTQTPSRVVFEVLNEQDHATYVFDRGAAGDAGAVNRAMALLGMRVESIYRDATSAASPYRAAAERLPALQRLRRGLRGRAIHTDGWERQLRDLL